MEERNAGGKTMQEVAPAHRSDLASAEHASSGVILYDGVDECGVMVGLAEKAHTSTATGKDQRAVGFVAAEHGAKIVVKA